MYTKKYDNFVYIEQLRNDTDLKNKDLMVVSWERRKKCKQLISNVRVWKKETNSFLCVDPWILYLQDYPNILFFCTQCKYDGYNYSTEKYPIIMNRKPNFCIWSWMVITTVPYKSQRCSVNLVTLYLFLLVEEYAYQMTINDDYCSYQRDTVLVTLNN